MNRRGQTMVLFALTMLLLMLMAMMTLSIGAKAKDKLDLQAAADAAAYSNAIATARTFNTASLLNRAAISDWVAMAGIQANTAWATLAGAYVATLGEMAYDLQHPVVGNWCWMQDGITGGPRFSAACASGWVACASGCAVDACGSPTTRSDDARAAAYEFWHAHYSLYAPGSDSVNQMCLGDGTTCTAPRSRLSPGQGQLDQRVADQQRAVWRAVHNLTQLELNTYAQLEQDLSTNRLATETLRAAEGLPTGTTLPAGFSMHGNVSGQQEGERRLLATLTKNQSSTQDDSAVQATMGSIAKMFPTWSAKTWGRPPPALVDDFLGQIRSNLATTHPGRFSFDRSPGGADFAGCAFFSNSDTLGPDDFRGGWSLSNYCQTGQNSMLGWKAAVAVAVDTVWLDYHDPCTGRTRRIRPHRPDMPSVDAQDVGLVVAAIVSPNTGALATHVGSQDLFWNHQAVGGCHGDHGYWNALNPADHELGARVAGYDDIVPGGLAFVFPNYTPLGAEGQPKLPTLVARHYDTGAAPVDPWNLTVNMRGGRLDIGGKTVDGQRAIQAALANGIAYYHRRGYWVEPANVLNPFWRATLVPTDADATPRGRNPDNTYNELTTAGLTEAAATYLALPRGPRFSGVQ